MVVPAIDRLAPAVDSRDVYPSFVTDVLFESGLVLVLLLVVALLVTLVLVLRHQANRFVLFGWCVAGVRSRCCTCRGTAPRSRSVVMRSWRPWRCGSARLWHSCSVSTAFSARGRPARAPMRSRARARVRSTSRASTRRRRGRSDASGFFATRRVTRLQVSTLLAA